MRISVVIPAYNAARWLADAIRSVQSQTLAPAEILVVDDGSTDETPAICASFAPQVRSVRRENGGLAAARNTGFAQTSGEWLLFLDADDRLMPDAIARLAETAAGTAAGVVYGFVLQRREPATETRLHSLPYAVGTPPAPAAAMFWWTSIATAGCALIRRSLNEAVGGFDESFRQVEDAEYWLRCGVTAAFEHCGHLVLDKTYHPSSLGQQHASSIWYRAQLQLKFLDWCGQRGVDTGFLNVTKARIFDHAFTRCRRQRETAILEPLLGQARRENVFTLASARAAATVMILRAAGRLPRTPAYCTEIYRNWRIGDNTVSS